MKKRFSDLGINDKLVEILANRGFKHPTAIQEEVIPLVLQGRDIIGQAETGSGKTFACGIPLVQQVDKDLKDIQVLVLAPTRELAIQYLNELSSIAQPYGLLPFVVYGGFDVDIQLAKLKSGVQMLVATPGRLIDLVYNYHISLKTLATLVIDEADEMLNMGFLDDVDFIKSCLIHEHQTLLFSATMPPPIKKLAKNYMKDAVHVTLNDDQIQPDTLRHSVLRLKRHEKEEALIDILRTGEVEQAIIFCNTRHCVKRLFNRIEKKIKNIDYLHGGLDQGLRTRIVDRFRKKRLKYIVTTDVMARGIDISGVSHIINYDIPKNPEIYIHRSGRTARLGKNGLSISFVTSRDKSFFEEIKRKSDFTPEKHRSK